MRKSLPRWIALALCCALLAGCAGGGEGSGTQAVMAATPTVIAAELLAAPTPSPAPAPRPIEPAAYFEERPLFWREGEAEDWDLDGDALADHLVFIGESVDHPIAATTIFFGDGREWVFVAEWPGLDTVASADFDGDGEREIALLYNTGGCGGAGQFDLRVLHRAEDGYQEMDMPYCITTQGDAWSFSLAANVIRRDGWLLEVFQESWDGSCGGTWQTLRMPPDSPYFTHDGIYDGYLEDLMDGADNAYHISVTPVLGEYALECRQYVSGGDGGHVEGVGDAVTQVLWRDGTCHIIGQWFEPYDCASESGERFTYVSSDLSQFSEGRIYFSGGWTTGMNLTLKEERKGFLELDAEVLGGDGGTIYTIRGGDEYTELTRCALADLDGDGVAELIALFRTRGNGGNGSHGLVILQYLGGRVVPVEVPGGSEYSGGRVSFLPGEGFTARIRSEETGFDGVIYLPGDIGDQRGSPRYAFHPDGTPMRENDLDYADTIYDFEIIPYYEHSALRTRQYMWHGTHINGFADWVSTVVLRDGRWTNAGERLEWYAYDAQ